jgi:hypothetical protein
MKKQIFSLLFSSSIIIRLIFCILSIHTLTALDRDQDQMSGLFERSIAPATSNGNLSPTANPDGDAYDNRTEFLHGFDLYSYDDTELLTLNSQTSTSIYYQI